jgi:hypothetical protein
VERGADISGERRTDIGGERGGHWWREKDGHWCREGRTLVEREERTLVETVAIRCTVHNVYCIPIVHTVYCILYNQSYLVKESAPILRTVHITVYIIHSYLVEESAPILRVHAELADSFVKLEGVLVGVALDRECKVQVSACW